MTTLKSEEEPKKEPSPTEESSGLFECNICLDMASSPVVTLCGHLYCWPCLSPWLVNNNTCPVCKSGCEKDKVVPIFAKGRENDPRKEEPRPEPTRTIPRRRFGINIGVFPLFPWGIQINGMGMGMQGDLGMQTEDAAAFTSRVFLMFATLVLVSIILY